MKNLRDVFIRLAVSFGAIGFILYSFREKFGEAVAILKNEVRWELFFIAVLAYLGGLFILTFRLKIMLKVHQIMVTFFQSFYLGLIGLFFNSFLPSSLGGDIVKIYYAACHAPGKKLQATTSIIMDRLMGFVALALLTGTAFFFYSRQNHDTRIDKVIYLFFAGVVILVLFFVNPRFSKSFAVFSRFLPAKINEKLAILFGLLYEFRVHPRAMTMGVLLSIFSQCIFITIYFILSESLNCGIEFYSFFILVPILNVISLAPSLGGLGVREAGLIYLLGRSIPHERALAFSVLLDILIYGYSLSAGIIYAFRGGVKQSQISKPGTHCKT